ncbi:hypothetical protein HUG15_11195 [Salicibibacter cibarius]|uniref:RNA polymerase sigma factor 70 region 1.1 domain-containing protein n=1 Tax=Salicibibacter cibarius TaxID=2743000 RepID=A0A7T6Z399_9BACI|nr:hypothetical protein [Salicibibacter cibarius]QQK76066.1 hypothetical protein HUG15_11195 [Salicibibacter cibarius]
MTREELIQTLESKGLDEVLELIEEADNGEMDELELLPSLGLLQDQQLNDAVLEYLKGKGVTIVDADETDG